MNELNLVFEKVGDIRSTYPYLCVYDDEDRINPFMEIAVTDEKQLQYTIYAGTRNIPLTAEEWNYIQQRAQAFLPKVLADEDS
ncbi:hypothetical protein [Paralysiella testudinis]|uniref:Uncharacterized protein n=1 Tax=Paralysiella testudinis TaxID=2809020 RepID=A0A892ZDA6_9NEIS|nr:hypothetical protein [Paralysiella testudinis]QRQ80922.1 hypothetical protein JQU52_09245 [Paralysiella testudinis]